MQSHELWFGSSDPYRSQSNQPVGESTQPNHRRSVAQARGVISSTAPANSLSALLLEERALRVRKQNIASFGYSWIKPAGCPKTMLGMKEEEAEREEALAAAAAEMAAASTAVDADADGFNGPGAPGDQMDADGQDDTGMERDLDDDIPDADAEGLVEDGEDALEEDDIVDEEGYMERDLDDDIPHALDDGEHDDFDNQPDLDDEIPVAADDENMSEGMARDLDDDIPEAGESGFLLEGEWQHTDTEAELDDDDDDDEPFAEDFLASTSSSRGLPPLRREIETEAQRRFLQRWSGGGDAFDSSSMMVDEDDLRASIASHSSRRSGFRRFRRSPRAQG